MDKIITIIALALSLTWAYFYGTVEGRTFNASEEISLQNATGTSVYFGAASSTTPTQLYTDVNDGRLKVSDDGVSFYGLSKGIEEWAPSTGYATNAVVHESNVIYRANSQFVSGGAFSASNWTALSAVSSATSSVLIGTENQVTVVGDGTATTTFSTPQDIHSTATPTFSGLTINGDANIHYVMTGAISATTGDLNIDNAFGDIIIAADGGGTGQLFLEAPGGVFATASLQVAQNLNLGANSVGTGSGDLNLSSTADINLNAGTTVINSLYSLPTTGPGSIGETIVHSGGTETTWGNATNAVGFNATTVSSNVTLGILTDTVYVNATPNDVTVTLASATSFGCNGKMVNVHLASSSGTRMYIDAPQTISGTSTVSAGLAGDSYTFRCDGSVWHLENYEQVLKRQMSCYIVNDGVPAAGDGDSGLCASWIEYITEGATTGDIDVRLKPGACSKEPVCVPQVTVQSNKECYISRTAVTGSPSKDLVVPHCFNPGVGNDEEDVDLHCECLK